MFYITGILQDLMENFRIFSKNQCFLFVILPIILCNHQKSPHHFFIFIFLHREKYKGWSMYEKHNKNNNDALQHIIGPDV